MYRPFGLLAAVGLALAVIAHALTFYPGASIITEDGSPVWLLHIGIFVVFVPMVFSMQWEFGTRRDRAAQRGDWPARRATWAAQMSFFPRWARAVIVAAMVYTAYNFFTALPFGGTPQVRNGQFVLVSHGTFIRTLSEDEYLAMKRGEVRGFSGHWIFFYLVPTLYFLFGRHPQSNPSSGAR